ANKQESYLKELSQKLSFPVSSSNGLGKESVELFMQLRATIAGLNSNIQEMNENVRQITQKELEYLVRRELERVIGTSSHLNDSQGERQSEKTAQHETAGKKIH
ncbi:MAG TPA: hypothetical protein VFA55_06580, partial [Candidatus Kapabacteria bacterium]|nr:hypothetical protein [Candidatus Kapabacteria bacterium]